MPFPNVKRIKYKHNPLVKVICQLRFPPILRIESEVPHHFQDLIRNNFPELNEKDEQSFKMTHDIERGVQVMQAENKNYEFCSEDMIWTVNLTRTFLSLSTTQYLTWDDFNKRLTIPLEAFVKEYEPAYFVRTGLRYIDVIKRSTLGLGDTPWSELLKPYALGFLHEPEVNQFIESSEAQYEIQLADKSSKARVVIALVRQDDDEECLMIDTDFYNTEKYSEEDVRKKLVFLHQRATRLIQWLIMPKLHEAMEPEDL